MKPRNFKFFLFLLLGCCFIYRVFSVRVFHPGTLGVGLLFAYCAVAKQKASQTFYLEI